MANNLTGDYDALVQVRTRVINGVAGTLHQNGHSPENSPTFQHSFSLRVGEPSRLSFKPVAQLANWNHMVLQNSSLQAARTSTDVLVRKAPPGISAELSRALDGWKLTPLQPADPSKISGFAQVQLGTPIVEFPPGATSEVNGSVEIRANFIPDPGTPALPDPIHGSVHIRFELRVVDNPGFNTRLLEVGFPQNDNDIQFETAPGTGLSSSEVAELESEIRRAVRKGFEPTNLELPQGFQFSSFKALGSGNSQVVALPVHLSGGPMPPDSALGGLNNAFVAGSDSFAIAVSKEFVLSLVQPQLDAIKASHPQFTVSSPTATATYTTNFNQAQASWVNNRIRINISGNSTTPAWWAPNVGSFSIQQDVKFTFDEGSQSLDVVPHGQPVVNVNVNGPFGGLVEGSATSAVTSAFITERDNALDAARNQIDQVFSGAGSIDDALKSFDSHTHAKYRSMEATGDGIILHGIVWTRQRPEPMVKVTHTGDDKGFSALKSWIPAGIIDTFEWTWVKQGISFIPWSGTTEGHSDPHRFILPKPDDIEHLPQICLYLRGRYVNPGYNISLPSQIGGVYPTEGGDTCSVEGKEFVFMMPSWWDRIMAPIWDVDPPPEDILAESILGHVESITLNPGETGANTIVHFANLDAGAPFEGLNQAFGNFHPEAPMAMALVLPEGSFNMPRRELERRLGSLPDFRGQVSIVEDTLGGWSRVFGARDLPATFLTNARGEFSWQQAGRLEPREFAAALRKHTVAAPPPEQRVLSLHVGVGQRAPDVLLESIGGEQLALRRLKGRAVVLLFCQSWSTPCLRALREAMVARDKPRDGEDTGASNPMVIAVNGGEDRDTVAAFAREHGLELPFVPDPDRRICDAYGIRCWPTSVSITEDGIVGNIRFGRAHSHR